MSHARQKRHSIRFELSPDNPDEERLYAHLNVLAKQNRVSNWIRQTLISALDETPIFNVSVQTVSTPIVNATIPELPGKSRGFSKSDQSRSK